MQLFILPVGGIGVHMHFIRSVHRAALRTDISAFVRGYRCPWPFMARFFPPAANLEYNQVSKDTEFCGMTSLLARIICSGLQTFACFCLSTICGQLYTIGGLNEKSVSYGLRDASNGTRSGSMRYKM